MDEALIKWGAAIFISFFVIRWLFELLKMNMEKKQFSTADTQFLDLREDKKNKKDETNFVDIGDCKNFRERIGEESIRNREQLEIQRKCITKIEKGLIYLVEKQGGNPFEMGLME